MKITKATLPKDSILSGGEYGYVDSFQVKYEDAGDCISSQDIGKAFFTSAPSWVAGLFDLRNRIVSVFGLKTSGKVENREELFKNFQCEPGEKLGLFRVYHRDKNEVILGEDDQHLNFRVSLLKEDFPHDPQLKTLTMSTSVQFHNWLGRLYFLPVKPFHMLIAPTMLKGIVRQLGSSQKMIS